MNLQVLEEVSARVAPDLGPLLEVSSGPESSLQSFNFLGNSLLAEVDHAIGKIIPGDLPCVPHPPSWGFHIKGLSWGLLVYGQPRSA